MNRNKEKHQLPEEIKETAAEPIAPVGVDRETGRETPAQPATKPESGLPEGERLVKAEQELDQLKDQLLRLRADFENYRKRALREKAEVYENANEALMQELLPVIDHFQLALGSAREHKAGKHFQEGFQMILDQLMSILSRCGLDPFDSEKRPFDANLHEAISCLPSDIVPEGVVITQSRPGYRFKNKILRPAQVVVSAGKSAPPQPEPNNKPAED